MVIKCIWEHNGSDTLLYAENFIGAFTRGASKEIALSKMPDEIKAYLKWHGNPIAESLISEIIEEKQSELNIADADSDVIFNSEKQPLTKEEYLELKALALKSAKDFLTLYNSIPDKDKTCLPNIFLKDGKVSGFLDLGKTGIADRWQDIALCVRSLKYNICDWFGLEEKVYEKYKALFYSRLGIEENAQKLRYYILLDELF